MVAGDITEIEEEEDDDEDEDEEEGKYGELLESAWRGKFCPERGLALFAGSTLACDEKKAGGDCMRGGAGCGGMETTGGVVTGCCSICLVRRMDEE